MASTKYERVCADCGDIATVTYQPKEGTKCVPCRGKEQMQGMVGKNTKPEGKHIRYWYFCPHCPSIRCVTIKRKTNLCQDCSRRVTKDKVIKPKPQPKPKKVKKVKVKKYKPVGYDGKQKVILNKPEIVIQEPTEEVEEYPQLDEDISRRMQEAFLAKRRVK